MRSAFDIGKRQIVCLVKMKYGRALILIVVYGIMGLLPLIAIPSNVPAITPWVPGVNGAMQVTMLFMLYPIAILVASVVGGFFVAPVYLGFSGVRRRVPYNTRFSQANTAGASD